MSPRPRSTSPTGTLPGGEVVVEVAPLQGWRAVSLDEQEAYSSRERLCCPEQPDSEPGADVGEIAGVIGPERRHPEAVVAGVSEVLAVFADKRVERHLDLTEGSMEQLDV
jgi:uncharacterized protein YfaP (DUF2135 family)